MVVPNNHVITLALSASLAEKWYLEVPLMTCMSTYACRQHTNLLLIIRNENHEKIFQISFIFGFMFPDFLAQFPDVFFAEIIITI